MDRKEKLAQIDAAWERVTEAVLLMDDLAGKTADMAALDIAGLLTKANRQLTDYRARSF